MSALAAWGVCKSFGRHRVLAGLDIDVTAGELVAVVGENGSGKTTLLRVLPVTFARTRAASHVRAGRVTARRQWCSMTRSPWTSTCATSRRPTGSAPRAGLAS